MIINHNISALNTHRQLGANNNAVQSSLEKLSSGMKINRAGDDAAGLAISEKMRAQIRGLDMATKNAQDGISLIQTAEGALNETHAILQRMRELAVQSASDTNESTVDRVAIQKEAEALQAELSAITDRAEFNTQTLLDGSFSGVFQIGANQGQELAISIDKMDAASLGLTKTVVAQTGVDAKTLEDGSYTVNEAGNALLDAKGNQVGTIAGDTITLADGTTEIEFANDFTKGALVTVKGGEAEVRLQASEAAQKLAAGTYEISGSNVLKDGVKVGEFDAGTAT